MNFYEILLNRGAVGEGMTHFERLFAQKIGGGIKELSGVPPLTFKANGQPLIDLSMSGQTVQASTPSPANPVAVEGVGMRTGNLFDRTGEIEGYYLESDGNLKKFSSNEWAVSDYISVSNSTQYTFTPNSASGGAAYHVYYDSSKTFISSIASGAGTFTTPNNAAYMRFSYRSSSFDIMLNTGSAAQPYEPYGYKIPITCGGTTTNIYLGSATSTRRIKKLVLTGSEDWTKSTRDGLARFATNLTDAAGDYTDGYVSHYTYSYANIDNNAYIGTNLNALYILDNRYSTAAEWKTYLAQQYANGTPVTIWYVLATPETAAVNEPLMKIGTYADELTKTGTGVDIPTTKGNNTLSVNTTVQPSNMYIKYHT